MHKIAIITDTNASLPANLIARHGIYQVPILVQFGAETLLSQVEVDDAALFARVDKHGIYPTTSAPSPGQFVQVFESAFESGAQEAICFCTSSAVSATYNAALNACEMLPGKQIHVIDSQLMSLGLGFMALAAAEAIAAGAGSQQAIDSAADIRERTKLFVGVATMKYLAMSGRVSHLMATLGNLLDMKPILSIQEGKLTLVDRVRTQSKAWQRMLELASEVSQGGEIERLAVLHANAPQQAGQFEQLLREHLHYSGDIFHAEVTPGLSVHTGPGMVGLALVKK